MTKKFFKPVHLTFYDHCLSSAQAEDLKPMICDLFGLLWKEDKLCYYVVPWVSNKTIDNENNECYVILKSTLVTRPRFFK